MSAKRTDTERLEWIFSRHALVYESLTLSGGWFVDWRDGTTGRFDDPRSAVDAAMDVEVSA